MSKENLMSETLYFAYIQALVKKHKCTVEEAQEIARSIAANIADSVSELDEEEND
jgi:hypothetical protein